MTLLARINLGLGLASLAAAEILPLLTQPMRETFLPQSIPFYAATQNFLKLRERHPQYMYKEATLNPTHPRDRAADWESDIIQRFRRADNGFGWQDGEIVGAQVISVPFASVTADAERAFRAFLVALIGVLALLFLALNGMLYVLLVRPVRLIAQSAERVSTGERSAAPFPTPGPAQIVSLARSFNRMRVSLDKAMRLLER